MKKIPVIVMIIVIGLFILCSCGEKIPTVTNQTGYLKYEIAEGWDAKTVTPAPSTSKVYSYGDSTVRIEALSYRFYEDPLEEALDHVIGECLERGGQEAGFWHELPSVGTVAEMPAKEVTVEKTNLEGEYQFSGIFTAIETETGIYTISTTISDEHLSEDVKKAHHALIDTVEYVTFRDPEVYVKNIFQFAGYISDIPEWDETGIEQPMWSSRMEYSDGIINYVSEADMTYLTIVPMDEEDLTDDVILETLQKIYNGEIGPKAGCSIVDREIKKSAAGSALYVQAGLDFGGEQGGTANTSAVFVMNKDGKGVCCLSDTSDYECNYDYQKITSTMREEDPVYATIDSLYSKATDYIGDNSAVGEMMNELEFGLYGDYTFELQTAKEPYGVTVRYNEDVGSVDFKRESIMLIGLIGNLDYVDIVDPDSNVVHYDYELAKSLMKYDVKKMAADKSRLGAYYLETLY